MYMYLCIDIFANLTGFVHYIIFKAGTCRGLINRAKCLCMSN